VPTLSLNLSHAKSLGLVAVLSAVIATAAVTPVPAGAAPKPTPARPPAYAATTSDTEPLLVLNGTTSAKQGKAVTKSAQDVVLSADGRLAYVAEPTSVAIVDARTYGVTGHITGVATATDSLDNLVVSPDGKQLFASSSAAVAVIDIAKRKVTAHVPVAGGGSLMVSPDGAKVYAMGGGTGQDSSLVTVIDTKTATAVKTFSLKAPGDTSAPVASIAIAPNGKTVYAVVQHRQATTYSSVDAVDTDTYQPTSVARISDLNEFLFGRLAISPDGRRLYAAENELVVIDLTKTPATATKVLKTTAQVNGMALSPDGTTLYAAEWCDGCKPLGAVDVIDVDAGTLRTHLDLKDGGHGAAVAPDQAPVAKVHVTPGAPGKASAFDASASTVQYGTIASYRWDFGDGSSSVTTTSAKASHVYAKPGNFTVRVTETSSAGTSTAKLFNGRMVVRNGGPSATTSAVVAVAAAHGGAGAPSQPELPATGPSDLGRNVALALALLVLGAALMMLGRRRHLAHHR
jgi:WD40 repeat protein